MTNKTISYKYDKRAKKINSLLCVGLDADFEKIPQRFKQTANPQFEFNKYIIEETHEYTSAYKPNIAFYEARGDQGIRELKMTMEFLQKNYPDIFTICDCKRADIGNTNNGYVEEFFDWFGFDAITLHPYLGGEALQPFLERKDKGSIILCRTSNPGSGELQDLEIPDVGRPDNGRPTSGKKLWQVVAEKVFKEWNKNKNCMLVVGATYPAEMKMIRALTGDMTFLVPGIGVQGGSLEEVMKAGLNPKGLGLIINSSRGIIFAENPKEEALKLCEEIRKYK
ncbi:MAG TPA: orotidine-5'-phosphate decarboxylase [Candidatus Paceibacterota bacterium]